VRRDAHLDHDLVVGYAGNMRSIWNGHLRLGLVTIPVGLAVARARAELSFRTLHRDCGTPIRQERVCPTCDLRVESDATVAGLEFSRGQFLALEPGERETLDTRRIEIARLAPAGTIPPLLVDRPWWLIPAVDPVGRRPYALLRDTLADEQLEAIATAHLWGHDHTLRVRPLDGALLAETLFSPAELRSPAELSAQLDTVELTTHERGLARRLARAMAKPRFDPAELPDRRDRSLEQLVEAKLAGDAIATKQPDEAVPTRLQDALAASLDQLRTTRRRLTQSVATR
jgi:DNA end-binding protein Ku